MQIIKPMQQGVMFRTFSKDRRFYLSVASLSFFPFHNSQALGTEQQMWETITASLYEDMVIDSGMPKSQGEVIVVGTHKQEVGPQVVIAQSQKNDVAGDQNLTIYGNQNVHVGVNLTELVDGDVKKETTGNKEYKVGADLLNNVIGGCTWIKASTDRGVTISDKEQINISGEISLNMGASEKVSLGAHAEQFFGKKNGLCYAHDTSITFGIKKTLDKALAKDIVGLQKAYETKLKDDKAKMNKASYALSKISAKMNIWS